MTDIPDAARPTPINSVDAKVAQVDPKTGLPSVSGLRQQDNLRRYVNGAGRIIPCSASTTSNVITLTPNDASPLLEKYVFGDVFVFWADATTSGAVTAKVVANPGQAGSAPLSTLKVYTAANGAQAGAGSVLSSGLYALFYVPTLDSSNGGFVAQAVGAGNPAAIESGSISDQPTLDIDLASSYDMYEIDLINLLTASGNQVLQMRFSQSGSFLSGGSDYFWAYQSAGAAAADEADSEMELNSAADGTGEGCTTTVRVFRPGAASFQKSATWAGFGRSTAPASFAISGGGGLAANTDAIDGVRFLFPSGNIASGYYAVRGYRFT